MDGRGSADTFLFEGFRLDRRAGCLFRLDQAGGAIPVAIGSRALAVLGLLVERRGELVSKDAVMRAVWPGIAVEESNLTVQISTLRRILDSNRERGSCIQTISGRGYCFVAPVIPLDADGASAAREMPQAGPRPRRRPSIVVLPFANLSDDREQQYFADGVTDDLTTDLSRLTDMFVISRNTAFTYRNKVVDAKQIGAELGVRYVLEGSVRRSGDRVRINAQLIDAEADGHLWAERFDRHLSGLFDLQDEVATAIAGAIEPELLRSERDRIADRPQLSQDAYELYQRGMWHHYRHTKSDNIAAQGYFRRALAIDPQYPQATAALALALCNAAYLAWADDPEANYGQSYELVQRAITLDARYAAARFVLGLICVWTGRSDRAMAEYQEAIKLNPNYAAAHIMLGAVFTYRGQAEKAIELAERGIRLSPGDPRLFMWLPLLAGAHYQLRHYLQAVEIGRRSWTLNPNWPAGLTYLVAGLAQLGRIDEARAALADLRGLDANFSFLRTTLQKLYTEQTGVDHILDGLHKAGFQ